MSKQADRICQLVALLRTHRTILLYLVFGVLTTLVNMATFWVASKPCDLHYALSNAVAWIISVLFAYATNRTWVFSSKSPHIFREFCLFVGCRLFSGICDMTVLVLCVEFLHLIPVLAKLLTQAIVVLLNYIFSKWVIFRKKV